MEGMVYYGIISRQASVDIPEEKSDVVKPELKKEILDRLRSKEALRNVSLNAAYWVFVLVYLELLLHITAYGAPTVRFFFVVGFSAVFACGIAFAVSFVPKKASFIVTAVLTAVFTLLYGSQMVYRFVFGTLYSVAQVQQGGQAITSFWRELLVTLGENFLWIVVLFVPVVLLILLRRFRRDMFAPSNAVWRTALVLVAATLQIITAMCVGIGGTGYFSNHYFYHSNLTTTDQATDRFGLLTAFRLNIIGAAANVQGDGNELSDYYIPDTTQPDSSGVGTPPVIEYNVLDIDFEALNAMTDDEKLIALNDYCASLRGTKKNEYTGMLSDYNLIVLCAEAFSPGAIHPEVTPTLYKLSQQGIIFNNYYNTFPNNTTDGEYALCMGQYPDLSRNKSVSSFNATRNSYLPFCLGNMFQSQKEIQSYGYHNYVGYYYNRRATHPNMGYQMKFAEAGMKFTVAWPASDYEMMQQSVDDYIGQDQFHAYYMTFSGHMTYSRSSNYMALKNYAQVKDLDMGEQAKCYLSCHVELDKALEYLMQRLEEEGVADRTAIVIAGDHYPYGMTDDKHYAQLVGYDIDAFNKYKSSLIFWVGGLEENIIVDEYCCNVDILPTILNLWGFDYDSRLLSGTDVFSDGTHMAVLTDMSIFTDKMWLNASTGQIKYLVDESELPANYVENMIKLAQTKMTIAKDMLNQAYYNFVFDAGMVKVNNIPWGNVDGEKKTDKTTPTDPTNPSGPQSTGPVETQPEQKPNPEPTPTPDPTGPSDGPPSTEATEPVEEETTPPTENTEPVEEETTPPTENTEPPVQTEPDAEDEQPE